MTECSDHKCYDIITWAINQVSFGYNCRHSQLLNSPAVLLLLLGDPQAHVLAMVQLVVAGYVQLQGSRAAEHPQLDLVILQAKGSLDGVTYGLILPAFNFDRTDVSKIIHLFIFPLYVDSTLLQYNLQVALHYIGLYLHVELLHECAHYIIAEVIQFHIRHLIEGRLLNVDDPHARAPLVGNEGHIGRGFHCQGRPDAQDQVALGGMLECVGQVGDWQLLAEIDDGVDQGPTTVLAGPPCQVITYFLPLFLVELSSDGPEITEIGMLASRAFLQVSIAVQFGNAVLLHPRPQVQPIRILRHQKLEHIAAEECLDGHVSKRGYCRVHNLVYSELGWFLAVSPVPDARPRGDNRFLAGPVVGDAQGRGAPGPREENGVLR